MEKTFKMEQAFAMWKRKDKNGKDYFTGRDEKGTKLVGFYNSMKQNPKEPDVRIYIQTPMDAPKDSKITFTSLWCNISKNGKKYLTGKVNNKKVVGFINEGADEKRPYFSVYFSDSTPKAAETAKEEFEQTEIPSDMPF